MRIVNRGRFLSKEHIWFETHSTIPKMIGDVVVIFGNPIPLGEGSSIKQHSLINDLSLGLEGQKITKTIKNEVNRSIRENVIVKYLDSEQLRNDRSILQDYSNMYHGMYESKGMPEKYLNIRDVDTYISNDCFLLSIAYINDEPAVYHGYIFNDNHCRLLHSCSNFRTDDKEMRNAIGRANKYLHWEDMAYFQGKGIVSYDWGGVSSFNAPNGIDKFKIAFGGTPVEYYNITINYSIKAKIFNILNKIKKRDKK